MKNRVGQRFPKQEGFLMEMVVCRQWELTQKRCETLLYFHCYLDDICMTPQMAETRSWQWPRLGCELRLSVAFEPLYWLHSKPTYPGEKLIKGSKIFWLYNELHVTRSGEERQEQNGPFPY